MHSHSNEKCRFPGASGWLTPTVREFQASRVGLGERYFKTVHQATVTVACYV